MRYVVLLEILILIAAALLIVSIAWAIVHKRHKDKLRTVSEKLQVSNKSLEDRSLTDQQLEERNELFKQQSTLNQKEYRSSEKVRDFLALFWISFGVFLLFGLGKLVGEADYNHGVRKCNDYSKQTSYETKIVRIDTFNSECYAKVNGQWTNRNDIVTPTEDK